LCREVIDTFRVGAIDGWRTSFQRLALLNIALTRAPVPQSVKGAMTLLGTPVGEMRRPRLPLAKEEEHEIAESLTSLGLIGPDR
jgi:dihydrodipicolinate synthase/N-acetylneuraminate lyase